MAELTDDMWELIKDSLKVAVGLVGTAAGIGIIYKGLGWIFSLFA